MPTLHLLFSHSLTPDQEADAKENLQISDFQALPADLQRYFSNVPPDLISLEEYAQPLQTWLQTNAQVGDYALVQGDFGLTFILVNYCKSIGLIPVYSSTERQSVEVVQENGSVVTQRAFKHKLFRKY